MKKVLFLVNSLTVGGVEKCLISLVNHLQQKDYKIEVVTVIKDHSLAHQLHKDIKVRNIFPKWIKGIDYIFKYVSPNVLYRLFIKDIYDIEIAYSDGKPVKILGLSKNLNNSKRYTWIHQDITKYDSVINCYRNWEEYIESYKGFNKVICISKETQYSFTQKTGIENTQLIYNLIDENSILLKSKEANDLNLFFNNKDKKFTMICVGRLSPEKGQIRLLNIVKKLKEENIKSNLILVGDGPDREEIEKFILDNRLSDSVFLCGFQDNPYKYMKMADLYVCPSYTEALSTTCIESIFLELPIITTNCPGMKEILGENKVGLIVSNDEVALYEGIKKLINNPKHIEYYRANMQKRKLLFCKSKINSQIIELFQLSFED